MRCYRTTTHTGDGDIYLHLLRYLGTIFHGYLPRDHRGLITHTGDILFRYHFRRAVAFHTDILHHLAARDTDIVLLHYLRDIAFW